MSIVYVEIESILNNALEPVYLELINESQQHSVPPNSETHFKLTLVSDYFDGLSPVKRHQKVYSLLAEQMRGGVHALALHLYTPSQWAQRSSPAPESPNCMGGG